MARCAGPDDRCQAHTRRIAINGCTRGSRTRNGSSLMIALDARTTLAADLPYQVYIEVTNRCNSLYASCPLTYDHFLPFEPKHHLTWPQFRRIVDAWSSETGAARVRGIGLDVALIHIASMSNLMAALGWAMVDLIEHPAELEAVVGGDGDLAVA
jgi:hypothetical protein